MAKTKAKSKTKTKAVKTPIALKLFRRRKGETEVFKIELDGRKIVSTLGAMWGDVKPRSKTPSTPEKAREAFDAMIAEQRKAGFRALGELDAPKVPIVRDERLEAAIRADREDAGAYMVYADWLQGQGNPLGEAIALAQRKKQKQAEAIAKKLGMPDKNMATVTWHHGLWKSLRLDNQIDTESEWDVVPFARGLFGSPLCAVLEELRIGMLRWESQDQPAVIVEAGRHAWAKDLRSLHVGDVDRDIDMDHHAIGDVGKAIAKSFPNLVALRLHSGSQSWSSRSETFGISGLELPKLETLVIETCALSGKRLKSLLAASQPALTSLELWFGDPDRDEPIAKLGDLKPILDGKYPKLRRLALRNNVLCTDLVRLLPSAKIAKHLEVIDLSMGTFHDEDAAELVTEAKAFPALRTLDVSDSYLTKAGIRTLKAGFPKIDVIAKEQRETYEDDEGRRYVSISE